MRKNIITQNEKLTGAKGTRKVKTFKPKFCKTKTMTFAIIAPNFVRMQLTILDVKGVKYMDYALIRDYEILDVKCVKYMDYALIRGSTKKQLTIISKRSC